MKKRALKLGTAMDSSYQCLSFTMDQPIMYKQTQYDRHVEFIGKEARQLYLSSVGLAAARYLCAAAYGRIADVRVDRR